MKISKIVIFCFILACTHTIKAQSIDATALCEQLNQIIGSWKRSHFTEFQGSELNRNASLQSFKHKSTLITKGAVKSEITSFKNTPNLNTYEIVFFNNNVYDETAELIFKNVYNAIKSCLKGYTSVQNAGNLNGTKDDDGDLPDFEFTKDGSPFVSLYVQEPLTDGNYKIILLIEEPEDE